jgi:hypothetical protein
MNTYPVAILCNNFEQGFQWAISNIKDIDTINRTYGYIETFSKTEYRLIWNWEQAQGRVFSEYIDVRGDMLLEYVKLRIRT